MKLNSKELLTSFSRFRLRIASLFMRSIHTTLINEKLNASIESSKVSLKQPTDATSARTPTNKNSVDSMKGRLKFLTVYKIKVNRPVRELPPLSDVNTHKMRCAISLLADFSTFR